MTRCRSGPNVSHTYVRVHTTNTSRIRDIASRFQSRENEILEEENEARPRPSDNMPVSDKISQWLPYVEQSSKRIEEPRIQYEPEPEEHEDDHPVDELLPGLAIYRQVIWTSSAYTWLRSMLRRQLLFTIPGDASNIMAGISKAVFSHEAFRQVTRKRAPPTCSIQYLVDWNPLTYLGDQGFDEEPGRAIETALTLTGLTTEAEALGCGDYLRRTWPQSGQEFLDMLRSVATSEAHTWYHGKLGDGTTVQASMQKSEFVLSASGPPDTVVEMGEQLAWIASALRSSDFAVARAVPSIKRVVQTGQTPRSVSMMIEIEVAAEPEERRRARGKDPADNGDCWQALFATSTTVQGYPIQQRSRPISGLEMPIGLMAALVQTSRITSFKGRPFVKGFCTMLFAVEHFGSESDSGLVLWHVLTNEDGSYIQYHDSRVPSLDSEMGTFPPVPELKRARHVVGWCSAATCIVGTDPRTAFGPRTGAMANALIRFIDSQFCD